MRGQFIFSSLQFKTGARENTAASQKTEVREGICVRMHATLNTRKKQRVPIDPHSFSPPPRTHKYTVTPPSCTCEAHSAERTEFALSRSAIMLCQLKQRVLRCLGMVFCLIATTGGNKEHARLGSGRSKLFMCACSLRDSQFNARAVILQQLTLFHLATVQSVFSQYAQPPLYYNFAFNIYPSLTPCKRRPLKFARNLFPPCWADTAFRWKSHKVKSISARNIAHFCRFQLQIYYSSSEVFFHSPYFYELHGRGFNRVLSG
jgi:hypothetical protein